MLVEAAETTQGDYRAPGMADNPGKGDIEIDVGNLGKEQAVLVARPGREIDANAVVHRQSLRRLRKAALAVEQIEVSRIEDAAEPPPFHAHDGSTARARPKPWRPT